MAQDLNSDLVETDVEDTGHANDTKEANADDLVDDTFDLEFDSLRANQLGTTVYRNDVRNPDPRSDVAGRDGCLLWGGTYTMRIACRKKKLRFGTFEGEPACLVVFDMAFTTSLRRSVYKSAMIGIAFDDCERAECIKNGEIDDDLTDEVVHARPRVLKFEPSLFIGDRDRRENPARFRAEAGATGLGGFGSVRVSAEQDAVHKSISEGYDKISAVLKDEDSALQISIHDNKLVDRGMIESFSVPIIVAYTPNRKFQARIRAEADLQWHGGVKPAFGRKDDPVLFDASHLRDETLDADLSTSDLELLTRLRAYGGVFYPSPLG